MKKSKTEKKKDQSPMYREFTCKRCGKSVLLEAGTGKLGLVKKPNRPSDWETINFTDVCGSCADSFHTKYFPSMWKNYMEDGKKLQEEKKQ